jgi:hypothetical protein
MDRDDPMEIKKPKSSKLMLHQEPDPVPGTTASSPALTRSVQAQLGQRLRQFYESLALGEQPVPDRFIEIINRLDEKKPETQRS